MSNYHRNDYHRGKHRKHCQNCVKMIVTELTVEIVSIYVSKSTPLFGSDTPNTQALDTRFAIGNRLLGLI
jgi:hypothetical protein